MFMDGDGRRPPTSHPGAARARRWPRRLLIAVNILVAACLVLTGLGYAYVRYRLDSIRTQAAPHLTPVAGTGAKAAGDSPGGLPAENILLIGNETRAGLTNPDEIAQLGSPSKYSGSLSDVIMILHLDPAKDTASILSIPRDLFLPMPTGSPVGPYQKVDAALNDGSKGPDNLIQAITDDLGISINHYIELEFDGFQNTVDALGGIKVDFPEPVFDANSLLDITKRGCIHLNGKQALALVRARHLQYDPPGDTAPPGDWPRDPESDLSRIVRDHTFLRILATTAEKQGLGNPIKLNSFLGSVINQITVDPGLKSQLLDLGVHYRHLDPAAVPELTLPVTEVGGASGYYYNGAAIGDVDFPVEPSDARVIAQWDGSALPAPRPPTALAVYNLAGTSQLATETADALRAAGLPATIGGDKAVPATVTETLVEYPPGSLAEALATMQKLSGAVMLQPDPQLAPGTVAVDAGSLLAVVRPTGAVAPGSDSTSSSSTAGRATATTPAGTAPSPPTPDSQTPSAATDTPQPWDPRPCS